MFSRDSSEIFGNSYAMPPNNGDAADRSDHHTLLLSQKLPRFRRPLSSSVRRLARPQGVA